MNDYRYEKVFTGVKRCLDCGFAEAQSIPGVAGAQGELKMHSFHHSKYKEAKGVYGETVLSFEECRQAVEQINKIVTTVKTSKEVITKEKLADYLLDLQYKVIFSKSLRFWDYQKIHPTLQEYITLLWNTPEFITEVSKYLSESIMIEMQEKYKANRKLKLSEVLLTEGYIFMNVEPSDSVGVDLSYLDGLKGEDVVEDVEEVDVKEIEESAAAMSSLVAQINITKSKSKKQVSMAI